MSDTFFHIAKNKAYRSIKVQCLVVLIASLITTSYSLMLGGLAGIIPSFIFAITIFQRIEARNTQQLLRVFYRAEVIKFLLMGVLLILLFKLNLDGSMLVAGFVLSQLSNMGLMT